MIKDFYPTLKSTIAKMLAGISIDRLGDILDACAGAGAIADYIRENRRYNNTNGIDTVEINPELQHILRGKKYRLVHDDFLTFDTRKHYDLIVANFPFSDGDEHLLKAIHLLEQNGGQLRCLVNAQTIRNPYTNLRSELVAKLNGLGAEIEYLQNEFSGAERRTDVEVALVKVRIEKTKGASIILDFLKKCRAPEMRQAAPADLVELNFISQVVAGFKMECELGIRFIEEYYTLKPHIRRTIAKPGESDYSSALIELKIGDAYEGESNYINEYLRGIRSKYWSVLVRDHRFSGKYTSNILKELERKMVELKEYDFTEFNIRELQKELEKKITAGIEESILKIFDEFSVKFAWFKGGESNIHYFNGWASNSAHKINPKIILPMNGFAAWSSKRQIDTYIKERLEDLVKVFNYLSAEQLDVKRLVGRSIEEAEETRNFSGINLKYLNVSFYKKGTAHLHFLDQKLLDKLNIYGSQRRGWLPPGYGKVAYEEMSPEARRVVDEFQGREKYEEVFTEQEFYLVEPSQTLRLAAGLV